MQVNDHKIDFVKQLPKKEIIDKKNLLEMMRYRDFSLWWFVEHDVYNGLGGQGLIGSVRFGRLIVFLIIFKALIRSFFGSILNLFFRKSKSEKKYKAMFVSYLTNWRKSDVPSSREEDVQMQRIIEVLPKNIGYIGIDQDTSRFVSFRKMVRKGFDIKGSWITIEKYLTPGIIFESLKANSHFKKMWEELRESEGFKNANGKFYKQLLPVWDDIFGFKLFYIIFYYNLAKRAIEIEKPNIVVLTCEYCALSRAFTIVGRKKAVPILGVMHGSFYPEILDYYHLKDEISRTDGVQHSIIPDVNTVFGKYYYDILTKLCNYPKESVVITGHARYDPLAIPEKYFKRDGVFKKLKLDPNKKLISWMTRSHGMTKEENEKSFKTIYGFIKNHSDKYQLVIKLHPNEYDTSMHERIAREIGVSPVIIKNISIFDLMNASDVIVAKDSTSVLEAILLKKPVVAMDFSGTGSSYTEGVAIVRNENKFAQAIEGDFKKFDMEKFIYKHVFKNDGRSAERVVKIIIKLLN